MPASCLHYQKGDYPCHTTLLKKFGHHLNYSAFASLDVLMTELYFAKLEVGLVSKFSVKKLYSSVIARDTYNGEGTKAPNGKKLSSTAIARDRPLAIFIFKIE